MKISPGIHCVIEFQTGLSSLVRRQKRVVDRIIVDLMKSQNPNIH